MRTKFTPEYARDYPATVKLVHEHEEFTEQFLALKATINQLFAKYPFEVEQLAPRVQKALSHIAIIDYVP